MDTSESRFQQRIIPSSAGLRMTPEEFDAITHFDERYRYELVHGVLVVTPPPAAAERALNDELGRLLRDYKDRQPQVSNLDAVLPEHEIRPVNDSDEEQPGLRNPPRPTMSTSKVRTLPRVSPSCAGVRMTPEEFDALANFDDRYRYELVRGVLVVTPPPGPAERGPNDLLGHLLLTYKENHPQGFHLDDTLPEHDSQPGNDRRRADRVIWAGLGRQPDAETDIPTIAIEYVLPGKRNWLRDYEEKRREYLALGVVDYWVIDRFRRTMTVYRNPPRAPAEQVVAENEVYRTDLLPGFELPLARLLTVADKWPRKRKKSG